MAMTKEQAEKLIEDYTLAVTALALDPNHEKKRELAALVGIRLESALMGEYRHAEVVARLAGKS